MKKTNARTFFFNAIGEDGQTFFEFILILLVMIILSTIMIRGFNGGVSQRWKSLVKIIADPTDTPVILKGAAGK